MIRIPVAKIKGHTKQYIVSGNFPEEYLKTIQKLYGFSSVISGNSLPTLIIVF